MTMKRIPQLIVLLFSSAMLSAQTPKCACCTEDHAAFDFWIGTWEVTDTKGKVVGANTIEKIQDSCVLRENWKGTGGSTGTSTNFFNLKTRQWEQLWVDNFGTHLKLKGNRVGNQMILSSDEFAHTDGDNYVHRITWTRNDDGTVRQLWELLKDDEVVNTVFDGHYKKKE